MPPIAIYLSAMFSIHCCYESNIYLQVYVSHVAIAVCRMHWYTIGKHFYAIISLKCYFSFNVSSIIGNMFRMYSPLSHPTCGSIQSFCFLGHVDWKFWAVYSSSIAKISGETDLLRILAALNLEYNPWQYSWLERLY